MTGTAFETLLEPISQPALEHEIAVGLIKAERTMRSHHRNKRARHIPKSNLLWRLSLRLSRNRPAHRKIGVRLPRLIKDCTSRRMQKAWSRGRPQGRLARASASSAAVGARMLLWDEIHGEPTQASTPVPTHDIGLQNADVADEPPRNGRLLPVKRAGACTCGGQRFESPPLHQEVHASWHDFLPPQNSTTFPRPSRLARWRTQGRSFRMDLRAWRQGQAVGE
jgi:hypothetical protein